MPFSVREALLSFYNHRYMLGMMKRSGLFPAAILLSILAFIISLGIIIPINLLMGGSLLTGITIDIIICTTVVPYHLYQVGRLLQELEHIKELHYQDSIHDFLTSAFNRRYFLDTTHNQFDVNGMLPAGMSLMLLDIDDFKHVNDTFGHDTGDEILKQVSQHCQSALRNGDIFARYGGEEFICLLPSTASEQAFAVADRLRAGIESLGFGKGAKRAKITVSIGLATTRTDRQNLSRLISLADHALYHAKQTGKNRVSVSS